MISTLISSIISLSLSMIKAAIMVFDAFSQIEDIFKAGVISTLTNIPFNISAILVSIFGVLLFLIKIVIKK